MADLFRPEVKAYTRTRLSGDVILAAPLAATVLTVLVLVATAGVLTFACFGTYASKESVRGWVTPTHGFIEVGPASPGAVEEILVQEGQRVAAREALATVRTALETKDGSVMDRLSQAATREEQASQVQEAASIERLRQRETEIRSRLTALLREREHTVERVQIQVSRVELARENIQRVEQIANEGYFPKIQVREREAALLAALDYLAQLKGAVLAVEREISALRTELRSLPSELASVRAEADAQRAAISQRRINAEAQGSELLRAPVAGRVLALPRQVGQAVEPATPLVIIAPEDARLEAELFVPSRAAGFIRAGQTVKLKYEAFPFQRFGAGLGTVRSVSRTVIAPTDALAAGIKVDEPVFRVRVRIQEEAVRAYGDAVPLQPGMLLNAEIITDRRTLLAWLLDPVRAAVQL